MTSTLQQEASPQAALVRAATMRVAQGLYENGYITYMRTDSTTLSEAALAAARGRPRETLRRRLRRRRAAHVRPQGQERPGGARGDPPGGRRVPHARRGRRRAVRRRVRALRPDLEAHGRLADGRRARHDRDGAARRDRRRRPGRRVLGAPARSITFRGFLRRLRGGHATTTRRRRRATAASRRAPAAAAERRATPLDVLASCRRTATRTSRPPRYTEASLVKALEERGIGRPSTYASIIGTILDRGYVCKKRGRRWCRRSWRSRSSALLEEHFGRLVDYDFTARWRRYLDAVAGGDAARLSRWLRRFYFGDATRRARPRRGRPGGLQPAGRRASARSTRASVNSIPIGRRHRAARRPVRAVRASASGRHGRRARRAGVGPRGPRAGRADLGEGRGAARGAVRRPRRSAPTRRPGCAIVAKAGRYGPYVTEVLPEDAPKSAKPRTGVAVRGHVAGHGDAGRRAAAADPAALVGATRDGEEITAQNGRYGPYIKQGHGLALARARSSCSPSRSTRRCALFAQPKPRGPRRAARRRCASSAPTRLPASRSWSGRAGSARTSPTARPTRRCARATPSRT